MHTVLDSRAATVNICAACDGDYCVPDKPIAIVSNPLLQMGLIQRALTKSMLDL